MLMKEMSIILNGRNMRMELMENGGSTAPFVNDWKDLEENLSFSEGLYCLIYDCSDISEADSEAWPNLKYIRLEYYGEDADVYEQELK